MTRSPDSLVSSAAEQSATEKRDDKAFTCRQEGEANLRAATEVNAVSASTTPPVSRPTQLELFPGRACVPKAKPATIRNTARMEPNRRDGVSGGGTQRQNIQSTGETLFGPASRLRLVGKRIRAKPESAVTTPSRESVVAVVPRNLGKTEGREGPLLPLIVQSWERQPDCPRKGRLHPGPIEPGAKRPRD